MGLDYKKKNRDLTGTVSEDRRNKIIIHECCEASATFLIQLQVVTERFK